MVRLLAYLVAAVAVVAAALLAVWLLGQVLVFLGTLLAALAGVLGKLAWYALLAGGLGGLTYFLASVYRRP